MVDGYKKNATANMLLDMGEERIQSAIQNQVNTPSLSFLDEIIPDVTLNYIVRISSQLSAQDRPKNHPVFSPLHGPL